MLDYSKIFSAGLSYNDFLSKHGTPDQQSRWKAIHEQVKISPTQKELLQSFKRTMPVVCLAGAWCGDCVQQCPIWDHFTALAPSIQLRFFDRDANPELAAELKICGGGRVPVVVFLSEDYQFVSLYGDRTVAKYRQLAKDQLGAACPTGLVPPDQSLLNSVTQEWLDQFERAQLILRLSPRLRGIHND
jgi:hypothetical protein